VRTYLEKHIPAKNMARYYRMAVIPNLFGEWTLLREWGRIGRGGQARMQLFVGHDAASDALSQLEAQKRRRGYWVEPQQMDLFLRDH